MTVITVFTTAPFGDTLQEITQGDVTFVFAQLDEDGPGQLVEGPAWAFIDWVMPRLSGLELCRRIRADTRMRDAHLTMVLDSDDLDDRRRALHAGADDYIIGPLDKNKILDRVLALTSARSVYRPSRLVEKGDFAVDVKAHLARYRNRPIKVYPNQFRLLRYFVENANRVLPRQELVDALGKQDPPVNERTVDKWVGRLRRSLQVVEAGHLLRTVHSQGYVLDIV